MPSRRATLLLVTLVGALLPSALALSATKKTIRTADGSVTVKGVEEDGAIKFLGMPFAEPPVEDLRFAPAREKVYRNGSVLDASRFEAACPQPEHFPSPDLRPQSTSEDCLYLNVVVPKPKRQAPPEGWPVMVWIHGGGFGIGTGGNNAFTGSAFADNGVLLVTINYRLGALGWLNYGDELEGNFGLSDQRMALEWVKKHVAAFGGDPTRVTVGGESAGAMSVLAHLASPLSEGLFDQAIVESGTIALPYAHPSDGNTFNADLLQNAGCPETSEDLVSCLRALPVEEIMAAEIEMASPKELLPIALRMPVELFEPFYPTVGTRDLPLHPKDAFESGQFNKVPLLIGNNKDEGVIFTDAAFHGQKAHKLIEVPAILSKMFSFEVQLKIRNHYPLWLDSGKNLSADDILSEISTDYMFTGSSCKVASEFAKRNLPVYAYLFSASNDSPTPWRPTQRVASRLGKKAREDLVHIEDICAGKACHSDELPYVFDTFETSEGGGGATQEDAILAGEVNRLWSDFIANGSVPARSLGAAWPRFDTGTQMWLNITGSSPEVFTTNGNEKLDFWDNEIGYNYWPERV